MAQRSATRTFRHNETLWISKDSVIVFMRSLEKEGNKHISVFLEIEDEEQNRYQTIDEFANRAPDYLKQFESIHISTRGDVSDCDLYLEHTSFLSDTRFEVATDKQEVFSVFKQIFVKLSVDSREPSDSAFVALPRPGWTTKSDSSSTQHASYFKRHKTGLTLTAAIAIGTLWFTRDQAVSSRRQAVASENQTTQQGAALLFLKRLPDNSDGRHGTDLPWDVSVTNIGRNPATDIVLYCEKPALHGPLINLGSLAAGGSSELHEMINEDIGKRLRENEHLCFSKLFSSYSDALGHHFIQFDDAGNSSPAKE